MPYREKVAWASIVAHVVVFGAYFLAFAPDWSARAVSEDRGLDQMMGAIFLLVLLSIVLAIAAAVSAPKDVMTRYDEREKLIRLRAANITAAVVTTGVVIVIGLSLIGLNGVLIANLLLGVLVLGEIVKAAAQIAQFHMSV